MEQLNLFPPKAVVVFSGGQDSTTCLFYALHNGFDVLPITFDYGQRHYAEVAAAIKVLDIAKKHYHMIRPQEIIRLDGVLRGGQLLDGTELDQYASHHDLPDHNIRAVEKTFVPMRNQIFLSIAANRAAMLKAEALVTGVCQTDSGGYPDCRADFIKALQETVNLGTFTGEKGAPKPIRIATPLMHMTKAESVKFALDIPHCYTALAYSHTAYDGQYPPTGHDHASLLRAKGFEEAGVPDPLVLRAFKEGKMPLPQTSNYRDPNLVSLYMDMLEA